MGRTSSSNRNAIPGGAGERVLAVPPHLRAWLTPGTSFVARSRGPAGGVY
ncbi:hypothetical protein [Micromonospora polyrhachis]|uniref:Uncharacterized protein n=1 Tax=Micromonospora polyrhachis TaxID=1282883 RepID=A0A7W7SVC6_9ACTN|nr:hypothetical protein [Micromonospora polyrhachis]MBB4961032.1 hypothetical protein [Micromonospora polyrhachis]